MKFKKIDWERLLEVAEKHKILPIIYKKIECMIPREYAVLYKKNMKAAETRQERLWNVYRVISKDAVKHGIKVILPKGFPIAYEVYGDISLRPSGDIDFLLEKRDILKFCEILENHAFFHRHNGNSREIVKEFLEGDFYNFYELKYLKYESGDYLWLEVKKATDAIPEKHIQEFLNSAVIRNIQGTNVWTLDDIHMFIHMCANAYKDTAEHEGICTDKFRLRNFIDIYRFVMKKGEDLDWVKVKKTAARIETIFKIRWIMQGVCALFPQFALTDIYIKMNQEFDLDNKINNIEKRGCIRKDIFLETFFDNDLARKNYYRSIFEKRWESSNSDDILRIGISNKCEWSKIGVLNILYSFEYSNRMLKIILKTDSRFDMVLKRMRLYFSFVGKSRVVSNMGIDSIGNPSKGACIYISDGDICINKKSFDMWTVNYGNYKNNQIENSFSVDIDTIKEILTIEIDVEDIVSDNKKLAYNIWVDAPVLDDYYRHRWYKYDFNQALGLIQIDDEPPK